MKIIELILGDGIFSGIEAISLVSAGAIEEDFIALKSQEVQLAEVSKEKRILMGALLVPNKPIYRKTNEDEYYIYFSKKTIEKASQLYLINGNQNNATLEHQHSLKGLTLVESWLIEDEVHDKSRKYGLNLPIGTWMGAVKVNSNEVWEEFVKTGKVKGFSIEGYFTDKAERPKEPINDIEMQAQEQLSTIRSIIKDGERTELGEMQDVEKFSGELKAAQSTVKYWIKATQNIWSKHESLEKAWDKEYQAYQKTGDGVRASEDKLEAYNKDLYQANNTIGRLVPLLESKMDKLEQAGKSLGIDIKGLKSVKTQIKEAMGTFREGGTLYNSLQKKLRG